jgi:uncharacterized membrane protein
MSTADVLRCFCALVGVVLLAICIFCISKPMTLDQRLRFGALAGIGVVVVGGQLDNLGAPWNWRMPVLALALVVAAAGSVMYLVKARRDLQ